MQKKSESDRYNEYYFQNHCGIPYERSEHWLNFFSQIAEKIIQKIAPHTVLDAGCAKGFLVEALRDRRVEAYGIDVSEYAIGEVREDMKPYCRVASILDPLERDYDLITCIEVLEHLHPQDAEKSVENMCQHGATILFSSTPEDFKEITHHNVQPLEYWARLFAQYGFFHDVDFDASFIDSHAICFKKARGPVFEVIGEYERKLWWLTKETQSLRELSGDLRAKLQSQEQPIQQLAEKEQAVQGLQTKLAEKEQAVQGLQTKLAEKEQAVQGLQAALLAFQSSTSWRLTASLRSVVSRSHCFVRNLRCVLKLFPSTTRDLVGPTHDGARDGSSRDAPPRHVDSISECRTSMLRRGIRYWRAHGFRALLKRILERRNVKEKEASPHQDSRRGEIPDINAQYLIWLQQHALTPEYIQNIKEEQEKFAYKPKISILTPVYNTDERWLRKAIESVREQVYPNWELCVVNDGSDSVSVLAVLHEYAKLDPRIRVKHLERNEGISGASNQALEMATGEFVGLLDHDDELSADALFEIARVVNQDLSVDLVYSDEDKISPTGQRQDPFFKPDWSPDLLLSANYICHFSVFRRSLLLKVGGFHRGFEGSQDYDLILRVSEYTSRISHIPRILYHWRMTSGSTAESVQAKPYAHQAGRKALEESLKRRGIRGHVDSVTTGRYAVRYALLQAFKVSIIIPVKNRGDLLKRCLVSIEQTPNTVDYEILIIDNQSDDPATLDYLRSLDGKYRVLRYSHPFNYSRINNFAAKQAKGQYLLFLNNDVEVLSPEWLTAMLEHAQRPEVGVVGGKLLYPDGRIQHAGVTIGLGGVAGHLFAGIPDEVSRTYSYGMLLANLQRNCGAVTGACMMMQKRLFHEIGGFEEALVVAFGDVDICLRVRKRGYLVVYTPRTLLTHLESASRGPGHPMSDEIYMRTVWRKEIEEGDPYYNINLALDRHDCSLRI